MSKIVFIYAHKKTDQWNTPLSILNEFKSRGWETEIYTLFNDTEDRYVDDNVYKVLETKPDIIIHMDWGQHVSPVLSKLKETGAYCVMESGDDPQQFERNIIKAPWFDLILSPDVRAVNEYKRLGYNAEWWTHFADTRVYYPIKEIKQQYIAVCSRGMYNHCDIIDQLTQHYKGDIVNKNGWHGIEHSQFLNTGKMILQQSKYKEITRRIFEGMACGKLVITDKLPQDTSLESLFIPGEDIILYDDLLDCANKIAYYNQNDEERERIALNGYNKVLQYHTQKQRVNTIIEKWTTASQTGITS